MTELQNLVSLRKAIDERIATIRSAAVMPTLSATKEQRDKVAEVFATMQPETWYLRSSLKPDGVSSKMTTLLIREMAVLKGYEAKEKKDVDGNRMTAIRAAW
jgi:hypothetical protein